jgi:nucleotide-binding universal stress UspA family protein
MLACGTGARPTILHIVDPMPAMYTGLEQMEETLAEMLQSESEKARALMAAVQTVDATCTDSEIKLRRGIVADEILLEAAEGDHDLIVMGSSRVGTGLVRVLMGDLTREICVRSHRPVLVVRPGNGAVLGT